jgi:hypothetical protein
MRTALRVIGGAGLVVALGAAAPADDAGMARDLSVVQEPLYHMTGPAVSKLKISAWFDHEDNAYSPGDSLKLFVRPNASSYITVVNVGTSGKVTVLFPNRVAHSNRVTGGRVLALPTAGWKLRVGGPEGVEVVKVFASTSPKAVFQSGHFRPAGEFRTFDGDGDAAVRDIAVELSADKAAVWAVDTKLIRIHR